MRVTRYASLGLSMRVTTIISLLNSGAALRHDVALHTMSSTHMQHTPCANDVCSDRRVPAFASMSRCRATIRCMLSCLRCMPCVAVGKPVLNVCGVSSVLACTYATRHRMDMPRMSRIVVGWCQSCYTRQAYRKVHAPASWYVMARNHNCNKHVDAPSCTCRYMCE